MITTFLQSEVQDPFKLYRTMLADSPIYWDNENKLWTMYSYEYCKAILSDDMAHIPIVNKSGLNEYALSITNQLARLSNGMQHEIAKQTAILLFSKMKVISTNNLFEKILKSDKGKFEIDWVNTICKKFPVNVVLKSFDFDDADCEFISDRIEILLKIMLPNKTNEQVILINDVSQEIYTKTEKHLIKMGVFRHEIKMLSEKYEISVDEILSFLVSNLIGLFIQSYDASRGILSNSLLQVLKLDLQRNGAFWDENYLKKIVVETLRFNSPIHNTRRVAIDDIVLNDVAIKKGESIFLVLASANRDSKKFENPERFNIDRLNNSENLTFGFGSHACLAKHFSINLTVKCLSYLFSHYKNVKLLNKQLEYEPMINVRLPKQILIAGR